MKDFIENVLFNKESHLNVCKVRQDGAWVKKHHLDIFNQIIDSTSYLPISSFSQRIYHIYNNLKEIPTCMHCGKVLKFRAFDRGYGDFCSLSCAQFSTITKEKIQNTCLEKYGTSFYSSTEEFKNRCKETWLKTIGSEHPWKNENIRKTAREKCNNEKIQKTTKNTCLEKYGVENVYQSEEIKSKIKELNLEKYGVEWFVQSDSFKEKAKNTWTNNLGVDHPFKSVEVRDKAKQTSIEKYGEDNYNKTEESKKRVHDAALRKTTENWFKTINSLIKEGYFVTSNPEQLFYDGTLDYICPDGHSHYVYLCNWTKGQRCPKCSEGGTSKAELDILNFISQHSQVISGNRKTIKPYQIDVFIPEHNLAIEYNGLYWHGERAGTPKDYHLNKTLACKNKGIDLIHIFEDEWLYKQNIVKSMLLNKLGKIKNKIYARKCIVKEIEVKDKDSFLNYNHIQSTCISSANLGLFYEKELVSVMTFGKRNITRGKPKNELLRFCNKINTSVVGGASKLFKKYVNIYKPEEVVSYADKRWFSGKMYEALGFELNRESEPNYWYVVNGIREHRVKYQKHKLHALLENFDSAKTEWQNMQDHGYDRTWDCRNMVYEWKNKN